MYLFYYHTSCVFSRQIFILLQILDVKFSLVVSEYWCKNKDSKSYRKVPMLISKDIGVIDGVYPIFEYLLYLYPKNYLFPSDIKDLCELRRLMHFINYVFYYDVSNNFINQKLISIYYSSGPPKIDLLKKASNNLSYHLRYIMNLLKDRNFLLYDKISIIDIVLACHISVIDYLGEINWHKYPILKNWYQIIKSIPQFRKILSEKVALFSPPSYYDQVDF